MITIVDCYTDEPAGLGVPPYLGVYPRYIAGYFDSVNYLTIDDLRFFKYYNLDKRKKEVNRKTNIKKKTNNNRMTSFFPDFILISCELFNIHPPQSRLISIDPYTILQR